MNFEEEINKLLKKIDRIKDQLDELSEESTKTTLIMPFFSMLGYDVFDSNEFLPEFTCDVATKKGEKVDYAIMKDGEPVILVEAKRAGMKLQKQQQGQLFRYFSTNRCRIALLTNGICYQFFSDLNAPNIMDDEPFLSFNLIEDDPVIYTQAVKQFCKEKFDIKNVISKAVFQKYAKVVEKTLKQDLISPSDEIVKYFLSRPEVKTGNRITAQTIEKYREITQKAMSKVLGVTILENINNSTTDEIPHPISENEPFCTETASEESSAITQPTVPTLETISKKIIEISQNKIPDFTYQSEDNDVFLRIHIYSINNQKIGAVKIIKESLSIQFRKFENGIPTSYELESADKIEQYL